MNAVLGMAQGLPWESLRPFVVSLRESGFDGDVHFFVAELDERTLAELHGHGVHTHRLRHLHLALPGGRVLQPYDRRLAPLHAVYPRLGSLAATVSSQPLRAKARVMAWVSIAIVARFLRYYDFLLDASGRYDKVMLTDVRDVVFQSDPFPEVRDRVLCFLEDPADTIGTHDMNSDWMRATYGEAELLRMYDKPITCVGVTFGTSAGIGDYLEAMVRELVRLPRQVWSSETAVHNVLCHDAVVAGLRLVPNGEGPLLTMGGRDWRGLTEIRDGVVVDRDGRAFPVLHQYDRDERARTAVLGRLGVR